MCGSRLEKERDRGPCSRIRRQARITLMSASCDLLTARARARGCDIFNERPSMEKGERSLYHAATFCAISPLRINQKSLMWKGLIMALTGLQHTVHRVITATYSRNGPYHLEIHLPIHSLRPTCDQCQSGSDSNIRCGRE